jgi:EAL and modified HD-GYP domain-containing signal transduction protein
MSAGNSTKMSLAYPTRSLDIFVGRQPIFDRYQRVFGYELLYRTCGRNRASFSDGDMATSLVILNSFGEIGIEDIVGDQKAFINFTRNFLMNKYPIPLLPEKMVIEVMEDIIPDPEVIAALRSLSKLGYQIALDDVIHPQEVRKLLDIANLVKIDLREINLNQLRDNISLLSRYKVKLLAEKVETREEFDLCLSLGFDYFQGYFLCKPNLVTGQRLPTSRLVLLQLLGKIQNPDIDFSVLEEIIAIDVTLGYKLLRLTNSAYYGIKTKIVSIRHAITMLGLEKVQGWLTLILMADTQDKPRELTIIAMIRAKMCEALAFAARSGNTEQFFLTGLFSSLDAYMDLPIKQILAQINLSDEIVSAILEFNGIMGEALKCVLAYERAEWEQVSFQKLSAAQICNSYIESIIWAESTRNALKLFEYSAKQARD